MAPARDPLCRLPYELKAMIVSHLPIDASEHLVGAYKKCPDHPCLVEFTTLHKERTSGAVFLNDKFGDGSKLLHEMGICEAMLIGNLATNFFVPGTANEYDPWEFGIHCVDRHVCRFMKYLETIGVSWHSPERSELLQIISGSGGKMIMDPWQLLPFLDHQEVIEALFSAGATISQETGMTWTPSSPIDRCPLQYFDTCGGPVNVFRTGNTVVVENKYERYLENVALYQGTLTHGHMKQPIKLWAEYRFLPTILPVVQNAHLSILQAYMTATCAIHMDYQGCISRTITVRKYNVHAFRNTPYNNDDLIPYRARGFAIKEDDEFYGEEYGDVKPDIASLRDDNTLLVRYGSDCGHNAEAVAAHQDEMGDVKWLQWPNQTKCTYHAQQHGLQAVYRNERFDDRHDAKFWSMQARLEDMDREYGARMGIPMSIGRGRGRGLRW